VPASPLAAAVFAALAFLVLAIALLARRVVALGAALNRARQGEARFKLLAEHAVDAGWIVDCASQELLYLAPQAAAGFGLDPVQLKNQLTDALPARIAALLAGDAACRRQTGQWSRPGPDGAELALEIHSTLIDGADGKPALLVGVLRDVSALDRERQRQEQAERRFASMLSHEFRSPLSTIDGAVQRLEMTAGEADEGTRKRYRKIGAAVERLLELIDQHLSPERMATLGRARQPDTLDPRALLEVAAEAARAAAPLHTVSLRAGALPERLRCDPEGMRVCLQVLLDNAANYAPAGTEIELAGALVAEGGVEFLVLDRGPGVAPDEAELVFDKGFRGRAAAGRPGSGLGLYMARALVDAHGGALTVGHRAGGGAAFRIWLPLPPPAGKNLAHNGAQG
jgi:two-component system, OmpR family, phosphate regulon sensor histidine kinase PhoR